MWAVVLLLFIGACCAVGFSAAMVRADEAIDEALRFTEEGRADD